LDSVSFEAKDGEVVGFIGLNGAGKTTTFRIATGVSFPTSGTVYIDGFDIRKQKAKASMNTGWVPEFPNFDQNAKAIDLMSYFGGFRGMKRDNISERCRLLFPLVGLSGFENQKFRTYSQGMKKRLTLGLALLSNPKNLLLDEILNGLDPQGIHFLRTLIRNLRDEGKSILLSSHILSEIETISDKIIFIDKGRIIKILDRSELDEIESASGILRIIPQQMEMAARAIDYLETVGSVRFDDSENIIWLSDYREDPSVINAELIKRGILIREFNLERLSLEDYFLSLVSN
jgi:ABC-2 type transport system ATP-binding protein